MSKCRSLKYAAISDNDYKLTIVTRTSTLILGIQIYLIYSNYENTVKFEAYLQYPWATEERFDPIYEIEKLQGKKADDIQLKYVKKKTQTDKAYGHL